MRADTRVHANALVAEHLGPGEPVITGAHCRTWFTTFDSLFGLVGWDIWNLITPRYAWGEFYLALTPHFAVVCQLVTMRSGRMPAAIKGVARRDQRSIDVTVKRRSIVIKLWLDGRGVPMRLRVRRGWRGADEFLACVTGGPVACRGTRHAGAEGTASASRPGASPG